MSSVISNSSSCFKTAKGKVMKQTNGLYPAPLKILYSIRAGLDGDPTKGYEAERTKFEEPVATSKCGN